MFSFRFKQFRTIALSQIFCIAVFIFFFYSSTYDGDVDVVWILKRSALTEAHGDFTTREWCSNEIEKTRNDFWVHSTYNQCQCHNKTNRCIDTKIWSKFLHLWWEKSVNVEPVVIKRDPNSNWRPNLIGEFAFLLMTTSEMFLCARVVCLYRIISHKERLHCPCVSEETLTMKFWF